MTQDEFIVAMAEAIAAQEGFYRAGTLAQRNHNPGNLREVGGGSYRVFRSDAEGWQAAYDQIRRNLARDTAARPLSLFQFFAGQRDQNGKVVSGGYPGWAPSADNNNPLRYAQFVAGRLGVADVNQSLSSFFEEGSPDQGDGLPLEITPVNLSDIAAGWVTSAGVPDSMARPVVYGAAAVAGWLVLRALL